MQKQILHLARYPSVLIVAMSYVIHLIFGALLQFFLPIYKRYFGDVGGADFYEDSILVIYLTVGVFGPLIETLLFQLIPIYLMSLIKKMPYWSIIIVSALCFVLTHHYSWLYVFYTFFLGIVYATTFLVLKNKRGYVFAFWLVFLVHAFYNTTVFFIKQLSI